MAARFTRDSKGIEKILKSSEVAAAISDIANQVAANAQAQLGPNGVVDLNEYETDRAAASILVLGSSQARDGVLTRAAAQAGLEVTSK